MAVAPPLLLVDIDFTGNPSASYYDRHYSDASAVSYWRLNSTSTFTDAKGVNNGVVTNAPTLVTGALAYDTDQGLSFNGTNEEAYALHTESLSPPFVSLEAWVKVASYPGATRTLVGKAGSYWFQITSTGIVQFRIKQDTTLATVQTGAPITTNAWHHLVGVYDGAKSYIYLDGILDQSSAHVGGYEASPQPVRWVASRGTAAPAYQGTDTAVGTGTSVTCNCPAGTGSGDLLIAHFHATDGALPTVSAIPAGWVETGTADGSQHMARVYYKVATGSEPANYTWTISGSTFYVIGISRFTGADPQAPIANLCYGGATAASTTHATGTHLPAVDNCRVLALFSLRGNQTWTYDSGTEGYDVGTGGAASGASLAMCYQTQGLTNIQVVGTATDSHVGSAFMLMVGGTGLTYTAASVDDTAVWNAALDANQVRALYEARLAGVGTWTSVRLDMRNLQTNVGRQYELNRTEAATGSGTLLDQDRDYDPANTASIHSPNVIPLRKIRYQADLTGTIYPLARWFIERWLSKWGAREHAEMDLTMVDGFEPLALAGVSGTIPSALSGAQINTVLDRALWPSSDRAIDDGIFVMAEQVLGDDAKALSEIQEIADSELGIFFIDAEGIATFHDSAHRWTAARSITSQTTFKDAVTLTDPGTQVSYHDLKPSFDKDNLVNEWKVATAAGTVMTARDEVSASLYFRRTQTRSTRLDAVADAQTQATALLQQTARPALRFDSLMVKPTTTFEWQETLSLKISDRVTVVRSPVPTAGGSVITKDCFVEGIAWNIAPGPMWVVTFQLSPVSTASYYDTVARDAPVSYWRLDTAA